MIGFVIRIFINAAALLVIASQSQGTIRVQGYVAALMASLVLGVANAVVKPILYWIAKSMTCVLSCLTLGLWSLFLSWLINGALFFVVGQDVIPGFTVKSFWPHAMLGALALSIVNALATVFTRSDKDED